MPKFIIYVWDNKVPGNPRHHHIYDKLEDLIAAVHDLAINKMKYCVYSIGECIVDHS